jgi:hypothetical protein
MLIIEKKMRTMTTIRAGVDVVSEDESDEEEVESIGRRATRSYRSRNWISRIRELTQTGRNGARLPPVGRFCLILKGDVDNDVGRMALVTCQTKSMVSVTWKEEITGATKEKLKHPQSLIQLEEGLAVEQDSFGVLWIVRRDERD